VNPTRQSPAARIPVVDDNQVDRSTLPRLLEVDGWQLFEPADAPAALSLARRVQLDLIVLDNSPAMPGTAQLSAS
jgi:CheY-like chemotaxis protein